MERLNTSPFSYNNLNSFYFSQNTTKTLKPYKMDTALFDKINEKVDLYCLYYIDPFYCGDYLRFHEFLYTNYVHPEIILENMVKFDVFNENRILVV